MSHQYPPQQGRGGPQGRGGRGPYYNAPGRGRGGMGAWQPTPPPTSSLQQAAAGAYQQQPPYNGMPAYFNPYNAPFQQGRTWTPGYANGPPQGMYFPNQHRQVPPAAAAGGAATPATPAVVPPRARKPLVITDKKGNVLDLSNAAPKPSSSLQSAVQQASAPDKLKQAAMEHIKSEEKAKKEAEEKAKKEAEEKAKKEAEEKTKKEEEEKAKKMAEEKAKKEAEEKAKKEAEEYAKKEAEEKAKKEAEEKAKKEAEEKAKKEAEEKAKKEAEEKAEAKPKSSLAAMVAKGAAAPAPKPSSGRIVYAKSALLKFKVLPECMERPSNLPDMTITKGPRRRDGQRNNNRNDGGGGGDWGRQQSGRRQNNNNNNNNNGDGGQWKRGKEPPKQSNQGRRGRGGRGQQQLPAYDGPPLVKSENHWRPQKNTSELVVAEKKVKSILNKMTKEKFQRLSAQMLEIPITTYETLNMMIDNVFDKAIEEPAFGDIYADLCISLSQSVPVDKLVHILESDEEPPTENADNGGADNADVSHHTVYRWSNTISTGDEQVVGPLKSEQECIEAALDRNERTPTERGEKQLQLVRVFIKRGILIKIMKLKDSADTFYTVYFPVGEAEDLGQQLSEIFLSQLECESDAARKNSFKRSLLNKCEEEFNKQDIYVEWKKEKEAYEKEKSKLKPAEIAEKEEELDFRRIRIKKQMLGNVKFIGQLYKKKLLKEKIMRFCIGSLLKLEQIDPKKVKSKNPEYEDKGNRDLDEEDHEAICSMFTTIGQSIDTMAASMFMDVCFTKIKSMSTDKNLPARSRFMYKDLLELRDNKWVPRRKVEKAKTLDEIRKDVEREERQQAAISQQHQRGGGGNFNPRSSGRSSGNDFRSSGRQNSRSSFRQPKQPTETDEDGFTVVTQGSKLPAQNSRPQILQPPKRQAGSSGPASSLAFAALSEEKSKPEPLSKEKLERAIKSMRSDFLSDGGDEKELMLSMDEMSGTPGAGLKIVQQNADRIMDCKEDERQAINKIITLLLEKGRISSSDAKDGVVDAIEFIDSMVFDSPRAYEYLGDLLGVMVRLNVIDLKWLCEQCKKITDPDPSSQGPQKVIRFTLLNVKKIGGSQAVRSALSDDTPAASLLGDKWPAIRQEVE